VTPLILLWILSIHVVVDAVSSNEWKVVSALLLCWHADSHTHVVYTYANTAG
jgi:hypothetical protein